MEALTFFDFVLTVWLAVGYYSSGGTEIRFLGCLSQTFEEGQTVANFVDTGPLTKVHARLAQIGSSCLLKMMLVSSCQCLPFLHVW